MAAYVALAQLAERPGSGELAQVATPARLPIADADLLDALLRGEDTASWEAEAVEVAEAARTVIDDAATQADGLIDGFLVRRGYRLPLETVPAVVTEWARWITRYLLHKDRLSGEATDPIVRDYRDAMKMLQLTAEGKFSLGAGDPMTPPGGGTPEVQAPRRTFSFETLRDFGGDFGP